MKCAALVLLFLFAVCVSALCDQPDYSAIDSHALLAPEDLSTVAELAQYLSDAANDDTQIARAIFRWIADNIAYDTDALRNGRHSKQNAQAVMDSKRGICWDYTELFKSLAQLNKLEVITIGGLSKRTGYLTQGSDSCLDHSWNSVKIDGKWLLLDCTWAAGYVDINGKFVKRFADYYFFTPPEYFLFDHLPEDEIWQLSDKPISPDIFKQMVYLRPEFFRNKLYVISNQRKDIHSDGNLEVLLGGPDIVQMNAEIVKDKQRDQASRTFVQKDKGRFRVLAAIPEDGEYTLRLYAKNVADEKKYIWIVDYNVTVARGEVHLQQLPQTLPTFYDKDVVLRSPTLGVLKAGSKERFEIEAPGADSVSVVVNGKWIRLNPGGGSYEGEVDISGALVQVVAKYPDKENPNILLKYDVD